MKDKDKEIKLEQSNLSKIVLLVSFIVFIVSMIYLAIPEIKIMEIKKNIKQAELNLLKDKNYVIINKVNNSDSEYTYIDTKMENQFYSEDIIEGNKYVLTNWVTENNETYAYYDKGVWHKYPKEFSEVAIEGKSLDIGLWLDSIDSIRKEKNEILNLGYKEESVVSIYKFNIPPKKAKRILSKKLNALYSGLVSEFEVKDNNTKYKDIINEYKKYIKEQESSYVFSRVEGKIGIYNNKIALFYISFIGGGSEISYSKIVAYDEFERRTKPEFNENNVVPLSEYAIEKFYKEK